MSRKSGALQSSHAAVVERTGADHLAHQPRQIVSPYLTAAEAIDYLKLGSDSALYRLIREHKLPTCRRGRLYLFDVREVDAWAHGHESAIEQTRSSIQLSRKKV
jgi:excisionase family DNA binding protein